MGASQKFADQFLNVDLPSVGTENLVSSAVAASVGLVAIAVGKLFEMRHNKTEKQLHDLRQHIQRVETLRTRSPKFNSKLQ